MHEGFVERLVAHVIEHCEPIPHPTPPFVERTTTVFGVTMNFSRLAVENEHGGVATLTYKLFNDEWAMVLSRDAAGNPHERTHLWKWDVTGDTKRWQRDMTLLRLYVPSDS